MSGYFIQKVHDSGAETRVEGGQGGVVEAPVEQIVVLRRPVPGSSGVNRRCSWY
jgi:hypothetical protein